MLFIWSSCLNQIYSLNNQKKDQILWDDGKCSIDLSRILLQCVRTIEPERGSGGHFHTFAVLFLTVITVCFTLVSAELFSSLVLSTVNLLETRMPAHHIFLIDFFSINLT